MCMGKCLIGGQIVNGSPSSGGNMARVKTHFHLNRARTNTGGSHGYLGWWSTQRKDHKRVSWYCNSLLLTDVTFLHATEDARQKVLATVRKVIAKVEGNATITQPAANDSNLAKTAPYPSIADPTDHRWVSVHFNPTRSRFFTLRDGTIVNHAKAVYFPPSTPDNKIGYCLALL
jgi:hypothetical protein